MFIRPLLRKSKKSKGKKVAYWALVESYRTPRGPRQRVLAYLGQIGDEEILHAKALGLKYAAEGKIQPQFVQTRFDFDEQDDSTEPEWIEIDIKNLKVENTKKYGKANRIWCTDRGMMSDVNIEFMHEGDRKYIIGAPKATLKKFAKEIAEVADWKQVREDVEVKMVSTSGGEERTFCVGVLLVRKNRMNFSGLMHAKFEKRIEDELEKVRKSCEKRKNKKEVLDRRVGRILQKHSRAAGLFEIDVKEIDVRAVISWTKKKDWQDWATLSEGCYLLRTNVTELSPEELWKAYIQLTEAEKKSLLMLPKKSSPSVSYNTLELREASILKNVKKSATKHQAHCNLPFFLKLVSSM